MNTPTTTTTVGPPPLSAHPQLHSPTVHLSGSIFIKHCHKSAGVFEISQTFGTTLTSAPPRADYFSLISQRLITLPEGISSARHYPSPGGGNEQPRLWFCKLRGEPCGTLHSLKPSRAEIWPLASNAFLTEMERDGGPFGSAEATPRFFLSTRHPWAASAPPFVTWRATQGVSWI